MNAIQTKMESRNLERAEEIKRAYQHFSSLPKNELLSEARRTQRVNDFSTKTSKRDLVFVIMENKFNQFWGVAL